VWLLAVWKSLWFHKLRFSTSSLCDLCHCFRCGAILSVNTVLMQSQSYNIVVKLCWHVTSKWWYLVTYDIPVTCWICFSCHTNLALFRTSIQNLYVNFLIAVVSFIMVLLFYVWQQNASRVLAIVWASVRLSVCPSVTLVICIKTVQARITKSSLWAAPRSLVYCDKILCYWVQGFTSNEGIKEGYPP